VSDLFAKELLVAEEGWARRREDFKPAFVRVDAVALHVGLDRKPRSWIRDARMDHDMGLQLVNVTGDSGPMLMLAVKDAAEGYDLLRALGFAASQQSMSFVAHAPPAVGSVLFFPIVVLLIIRQHLPHHQLSFFGLLAIVIAFSVTTRVRVEVGTDGVAHSWFGRKHFIPMSRIRDVEQRLERRRSLVLVHLRDGSKKAFAFDKDVAGTVVERVREAMALFASRNVTNVAPLLLRSGRALPEWIAELRALGVGANATLRTAPIRPEQLWGVVESPATDSEARAGAAVALATAGDVDRSRLRVVAATAADDKLRRALDAACGSDDEALEEALRNVCAGEGRE
jgi:hypothetical protein